MRTACCWRLAVGIALLAGLAEAATSVHLGFLDRLQEKAVKLPLGDDFRVVLDSNPTTGYQWKMEAMEGPNLTEVGNVYQPASSSSGGMVGGGGEQVFDFKAVSAGSTKLIFNYARAWEETPASRAVITVVAE